MLNICLSNFKLTRSCSSSTHVIAILKFNTGEFPNDICDCPNENQPSSHLQTKRLKLAALVDEKSLILSLLKI